MKNLPRASVKEVAHKIKGYGNPRFAFFLGAGASRQSNIITAGEMMRHFKERIITQCCPDSAKTNAEKEAWLAEEGWYKETGSEYCKLFEKFEPKEIGRQRYIESIIEGREPSFGYVVLANLMANKYINTIITTNFDDLVYSACTTFTSFRPIVYAYGVMASEMRITAQRPKILKLHGDFLYSTLKNTGDELAEQDPNMARQLRQVLSEYGLIVTGYSGGDESIMKILAQISDRNDLYWCLRRGEEPNDAVKKLLSEKGGFIVEIEGFDEMMNEIRRIVEFDVPKMVGSIQERQNQMIEQFKKFEPKYSADILGEIAGALKESPAKEDDNRKIQALDFFSQAYKAFETRDFTKAEELYVKVIKLNPSDAVSYNNLGLLFSKTERKDEAEAAYRKAIELNPNLAEAHNNLGALLYGTRPSDEVEVAYRKAIELNPNYAEAHNNLGLLLSKTERKDEAEAAYRKAIELNPDYASAYNNLGFLLSKTERKDEAEAAYRKAIELNPDLTIAYNNLINLLNDAGREDEVEVAYRQFIQLYPKASIAYYNLVNLLRSQNREAEAVTFAERALQLDSKNQNLLINLTALHKKLGQSGESKQYAAQAREVINSDDWYNLACLESICENTEAAIENLQRAAQQDSFNLKWARQDPDLEWIRDDPRFKEIVGEEDA